MSDPFQLIAGSVPLDFANTLDNRGQGAEREKELLSTYGDLIAFAQQAEMIPPTLARKLLARAAREPKAANAILMRARKFREALYCVASAIALAKAAAPADLAVINREITSAAASTQLQNAETSFAWTWCGEDDALERPLWSLVRATADLLTSDMLDRVRLCEDDKCRWAFLDTSRNRSRRWCEMRLCGNRAKVRRFHQRHNTG